MAFTKIWIPMAASLTLGASALGCGVEVELPGSGGVAFDLQQVVRISGAGMNTCGLRAGGDVVCWGDSFGAQMIEAIGVSDAVEIGVGAWMACVRLRGGQVACWTLGWKAQNGPIELVPELDDAIQISVGANHACAVRDGGEAVCWGANSSGQLGDGTLGDSHDPVVVKGLSGVREIAAGEFSTCARLEDGSARCWGRSLAGQLGDGAAHPACTPYDNCSVTPVVVSGLDDAVEISAGLNGACARRSDGSVAAWGWNGAGEVGDGTLEDRAQPAEVVGLSDATRVYAGYLRKCAVRSNGDLVCWGYPTGTEPAAAATKAQKVDGLGEIVDVTGGWYHACALDRAGQVFCWGDNEWCQLGDGTLMSRSEPAPVEGP